MGLRRVHYKCQIDSGEHFLYEGFAEFLPHEVVARDDPDETWMVAFMMLWRSLGGPLLVLCSGHRVGEELRNATSAAAESLMSKQLECEQEEDA